MVNRSSNVVIQTDKIDKKYTGFEVVVHHVMRNLVSGFTLHLHCITLSFFVIILHNDLSFLSIKKGRPLSGVLK
jgi:hypothetical protein